MVKVKTGATSSEQQKLEMKRMVKLVRQEIEERYKREFHGMKENVFKIKTAYNTMIQQQLKEVKKLHV